VYILQAGVIHTCVHNTRFWSSLLMTKEKDKILCCISAATIRVTFMQRHT